MSAPEFLLDGKAQLYCGDCLAVLPRLAEASFDACVTDPPYHLASIVKRFGAEGAAAAKSDGATGVYRRASAGFMGKQWDGGAIAFDPATWAEVYRVLKPGAHLAAFAAPKNAHRLTSAIEDAGFEIRDVVMWLFGQGFPKSHDVGKAIIRSLGATLEADMQAYKWDGWGTALKPAYEPIILARKPLVGTVAENVLAHGTGAINIDACRIEINPEIDDPRLGGVGTWSTDKMAKTVYAGGYRGERVGSSLLGRWPANVAHDGSDEVIALFPDSDGQQGDIRGNEPSHTGDCNTACYGEFGRVPFGRRSDQGSAARFFYCAKATADERAGSRHPTVKPLALMRWLVRMVTPKDGLILDPFAGTGTTAEAAIYENARAALIEKEADSQADIRRRMGLVVMGPDERAREIVKATQAAFDPGPLFGGASDIG